MGAGQWALGTEFIATNKRLLRLSGQGHQEILDYKGITVEFFRGSTGLRVGLWALLVLVLLILFMVISSLFALAEGNTHISTSNVVFLIFIVIIVVPFAFWISLQRFYGYYIIKSPQLAGKYLGEWRILCPRWGRAKVDAFIGFIREKAGQPNA